MLACGRRTEKRDARREVKALKAAKVETAIETELLARLKQGTYGDIYNFDQKVYERVLQAAEVGRPAFPVCLNLPSPIGLKKCENTAVPASTKERAIPICMGTMPVEKEQRDTSAIVYHTYVKATMVVVNEAGHLNRLPELSSGDCHKGKERQGEDGGPKS